MQPAAPTTFSGILAEKNFARLWYGQIISSLGDRFYQFALLYVILGIKQGMDAGKDSARVTFCAMLPGLLLAPLYGWIVDRFSRRWVMFYADLARGRADPDVSLFWFQSPQLDRGFRRRFSHGRVQRPFHSRTTVRLAANRRGAAAGHRQLAHLAHRRHCEFHRHSRRQASLFRFSARYSSFLFNSMGFLASAWCIYHIDADFSPGDDPFAAKGKDTVNSWRGVLGGWNVLREQQELGALVLVNSAFSFISAMALITILQQIVVSIDLTSVQLLVNTLTKFLSLFAPKPPVFEIKTLAFGLLMAAIGLGLGLGVALCGASETSQPQQGATVSSRWPCSAWR